MQTSHRALPDDPARVADHGHFPAEASIAYPEPDDEAIIGTLCDLFAGRLPEAFGERLDWWMEALRCDFPVADAAGVALAAISKWQFDQRVGAVAVAKLRRELIARARLRLAHTALQGGR